MSDLIPVIYDFVLKPYSSSAIQSGEPRLVRNISPLNDPSRTNHPACHQKLHEATKKQQQQEKKKRKRFIPVEIMLSFSFFLPLHAINPLRSVRLLSCSVWCWWCFFFSLSPPSSSPLLSPRKKALISVLKATGVIKISSASL